MIRLVATVDGFPVFDRAFLKVEQTQDDFHAIFEEAGDQLLEWNREQFASEGGAAGTPWQKLSDRYAGWKAIVAPGKPILQLSSEMMNSLTQKGVGDNVWRVGKKEAEFGSTSPLAGYHHRGGGNLPAREILVVDAQRRTQLMKRAQARLIEELKSTGLVRRTG